MTNTTEYRELSASEVTLDIDPKSFGFETTAELEPLTEIVGQPRALRALDLGTGIRHPNYHIYIAGLVGTGRMELVTHALRERVLDDSTPLDWVYVNNFDEPDCPLAISLPAGQGVQLRGDMETLIEQLQDSLPKAFKEEDFGKEKEKLRQVYRKRGDEVFEKLLKQAEQYGMTVQQLPDGQIIFIPLKDNRPMTQQEIEQLTPEEMKVLDSHQDELVEIAGRVLQEQREIQRQLSTDVREVAQRFAVHLVEPLVEELQKKYDNPKLSEWFDRLKVHIIDHLNLFRDVSDMPPQVAAMMMGEGATDPEQRFLEYRINVVVDNSQLKEPPIIVEDAPNYRNLFGTIDRVVDHAGRVITNFTRIKSGSILKANGGYLVVNLMDAIIEPFVWKELKRTLKSQSLGIQVQDPFAMFTVTAMQPEPIPLNVRLVALGEPLIYHLLYLHDEDFREIFRVKADFDPEMNRDEETGLIYGRLVRQLSEKEELLPFDAAAIAELVCVGARLASDQKKVTSVFSHIADVAREASFWASKKKLKVVKAKYVRQAVQERVFRSDMIAEKIRGLIADGTLLIQVEGTKISQINGLAVADLGDYAFGRPSRLTASVGVGTAGIINIERESRMSGSTFDKSMLILEGLLRNYYAGEQPLTLSASIAMEQSYGGVDGDSASVAELLCLLSALANVPLRQDLAVTGSINQWGEVQAIGGVNEKIEGFFDVCNESGLTGTQGVCFPESNAQNLVLRDDIVKAIRKKQFHVWAISDVDQAIELFTGMSAGDISDKRSFHGRVLERLTEIATLLEQQMLTDTGRLLWTPGTPLGLPPDPRPPLPGQ
ncbi:ATP-binding protein [uncultured Gimesia sp.]|uniref:Lon protease family protein n=1 Tax=uncultured Gimesia sp. TaxID=1678688 RepID=UPI0030DBC814|tara:strand:+ start:40668 stop:43145 length:2478 start_codon:yes stop_codon:yes gene_type:complete